MPSSAGSSQPSKWYVSCALILLSLVIGVSFLISSTSSAGDLIIGVPVILILLSVGFLVSILTKRTAAEEVRQLDVELGLRDTQPSELDDRNPFTDCPPSYRLTWRRSFLKRLKSTSMFSDRSAENTPQISPESKFKLNNSTPEAAEATISTEYRSSQEPPSVNSNQTTTIPESDDLPTYDEALKLTASREQIS